MPLLIHSLNSIQLMNMDNLNIQIKSLAILIVRVRHISMKAAMPRLLLLMKQMYMVIKYIALKNSWQ
jgi:hypothetical protein